VNNNIAGNTLDNSGAAIRINFYLLPNTRYNVRAYATNSAGTAYGSEVIFTTSKKELTIGGSFHAEDKEYDCTT